MDWFLVLLIVAVWLKLCTAIVVGIYAWRIVTWITSRTQ